MSKKINLLKQKLNVRKQRVVQHDVKRLIDANLNRLREALRVVEEVVRLLWNNKEFSFRIKKLRHEICKCEKNLPWNYNELIVSRDSQGDVGRGIAFDIVSKKSYLDVFKSNLRRAQESSRVLEEFSSLFDENSVMAFKKIRFALYSFEKEAIGYEI